MATRTIGIIKITHRHGKLTRTLMYRTNQSQRAIDYLRGLADLSGYYVVETDNYKSIFDGEAKTWLTL